MQPSITHRERAANQRTHLLPTHPSSIPVEAASRLPLQPKLEVGSVGTPFEAEADRMAAQVTTGRPLAPSGTGGRSFAGASGEVQPVDAPPSVHDALRSPGCELDPGTLSFMEPRFGADLRGVRIHTGGRATEAAQSVQAQAYTVGQDIFFGPGKYNPQTGEGRRLLAHELSHTLQQSGRRGRAGLSKAARTVQRDPIPDKTTQGTTTDKDTKKPKTDQVTIPVPPSLLSRFQLIPPSLLAPGQKPPFFSPGGSPLPLIPPPSQYTPSPLLPQTTPSPYLSPTPQGSGAATPTTPPKAPDRVSLHDFGSLSIGARFGFPDLQTDQKPGDPPSGLQESIKQAEIVRYEITGQLPSEYSIDPGKLVGAVWGIFSTRIDPSLAKKIAAAMSSKPTGGGLKYQLDATILLNLGGPKPGGGGGATLTVSF